MAAHPVTALFHVTVTDEPVTLEARPVGVPGGPTHGDAPTETTIVISLVAVPVPALLRPRTRTKYVPAGTAVTVSVTAALPVSKLARLDRPLEDPASTRYEVAASPLEATTHDS